MTTACLPTMLLAATFTLTSAPIPDDAQPGPNLVQNGNFEQGVGTRELPAQWQTSGRSDIEQSLRLDAGRAGGQSARLTCTRFVAGTPDAHVMMCQLGVVGIERGKWYRLSFWVKGDDLSKPVGSVAVSNTRPWGSSGVEGQYVAGKNWRHIELFCQATDSVPAPTSRLQFWFSGTGTIWFDDIQLQAVQMTEEFHPAIATQGITNLIPNSSFECGRGQWGSYSPRISTWAGNINQQLGVLDSSTARHGQQSLRIDLDRSTTPVFCWDYYEPIVEPTLTIVCANEGWVPVQVGESYVLSCYLKANQPDVPALLLVHNAQRGSEEKTITVDQQWTRYEFVFRPRSKFIWIGAGIDLAESSIQSAQLWIDAAQLERGDSASPYSTRSSIESTLTTPAVGNIFVRPDEGLSVDLHLCNASDSERTIAGRMTAQNFFDREIWCREIAVAVPARASHVEHLTQLFAGQPGFYRVTWSPSDHDAPYQQSLRCALLQPYGHRDSPFGMNHAYPWDFMLELCRQGGLTWMRDWSAKWNTVEPRPGEWDFSRVDPQIDRIRLADLNALVLLPFASAAWCSAADLDLLRQQVGGDTNALNRALVACPANEPALFRHYVAKTVERYRNRVQWIEIMNEPLYTSYAVPAAYGYQLEDYLQVLRHAHESIKATSPETRVIGGIGAWVDSHWVREFIDAGGLQWCDAMDIHLYPITAPPETYEEELAHIWQQMQSRGEAKPIWLTEFGCYADDDPYKTPGQIGDSTMSRANWPSEQAASEALVKTAAVFLSHGVRKIFYHAGTCGPINSSSGGGIFFEYGGAPSKMYAAQNALANQLGPTPVPQGVSATVEHLHRYLFDTQQGFVAIVWAAAEEEVVLPLPPSVTAYDLMSRPLPGSTLRISGTPVYLRSSRWEDLGK